MKKKVYLLICLLLLSAGFSSCSSDLTDSPEQPDLQQSEIPVTPKQGNGTNSFGDWYNELSQFLTNALPDGSNDNDFFTNYNNSCVIIHNEEEFSQMYHGKNSLPKVDFEKYSLVVGQQSMEQYGYSVQKQEIVFTKNGLMLNLYVHLSKGYHDQAFMSLYYWGLYRQLKDSKISVNVIKQ
jgi:hypothetical protein